MSRDSTDIRVDHEPLTAHYQLNGRIGKGSFGTVVVGVHILTQTKVAVKILKHQGSDERRRSLLQEVRCMADLRHPNIVPLFHVVSSAKSLYLVLEFVPGGDILDYLSEYGRMSENTARGVFRQLVSAVHYCHDKGVVHRDLKPENVLLDSRMQVALTDFGLGASSDIHELSTCCGTPLYAAPELFLRETYDGCAADTWSLGVVLYEMLTNMVPFSVINWPAVIKNIGVLNYSVPNYLSTHVANLLQKLLNLSPEQRPNLRDIMSDPWINMGQEEEMKPYVEPPSDVIDTWVVEEMVSLGFGEEDIRDTLSNKIYNNTLATYHMLQRKILKFHHRIIKVKPFQPPEFQSRSPSPAQEVQSELSSGQKAEQLPVDQEPEQKSQESAGPTYIQDYSTAISQARTTLPPSSPGSKTAIPEPSRESRNATPEPSPPKHCWGSRTSTLEHSQGSRKATLEQRSGFTTAIPEPSQGSRTAIPEERSGSRTATPEPSQGSRTATLEQRSGSTTAIPEHRPRSRTATPELSPGSSTILSPAPQCHPGDSLSSHSTTSSPGNQQKIKRGRRQVVRGCLNFLRKVFCLPPKRGH